MSRATISPWIKDEAHNNKKQENGGSELKTQTSKTKTHEDTITHKVELHNPPQYFLDNLDLDFMA